MFRSNNSSVGNLFKLFYEKIQQNLWSPVMGDCRHYLLGHSCCMSARYGDKIICKFSVLSYHNIFPGLSSTPIGFSSRVIFFLGYLTSYLLYTGFAAGITSLVAVQNQQMVLTIQDIERMKLNVVSFGDIRLPYEYDYLVSRNNKFTTYISIRCCL